MKKSSLSILVLSLLIQIGCTVQFIPDTTEDKDLLVVEGMITDQNRKYKIKLSKSLPLGKAMTPKPFKGGKVTVRDERGSTFIFTEAQTGTYVSDSTKFRGRVGGKYTLFITANNLTYTSQTMEMKPAPPIDSVYYEKEVITASNNLTQQEEGCRIYLDSHDPSMKCLYYRWDFTETWEFRLPFGVPNRVCWISNPSDAILIKNTAVYNQARVSKFPLLFVSNETDRLKVKYSILVNQYSLNESEFNYWEKLQNVSGNVGGLYDITPMAIPSNISCNEDRNETVLGYFSVSAISQKRIFIKDQFLGIINLYGDCVSDTIYGSKPIPGLNVSVWILEQVPAPYANPPYTVLTMMKGCADCTVRGSTIKPVYWDVQK
jgi:hypothetical protein